MVLLTFDIEEFDLPQEYGQEIDFAQQIAVSVQGLIRILEVLERQQLPATFYSTVRFMEHLPEELRERLLSGGHEIASHGVSHSTFAPEDYARSRQELRKLTGQEILGFRMARMQPIDRSLLREAGYRYDSSLNPTWLPGRYNHWTKPRHPFTTEGGLWTLPTAVTPLLRFPLFWLSMHNLPLWLYKRLTAYTARHSGYLNIYFHPWEFADLRELPYRIPSYILRNSGETLAGRLEKLIGHLRGKGETFITTEAYLKTLEGDAD